MRDYLVLAMVFSRQGVPLTCLFNIAVPSLAFDIKIRCPPRRGKPIPAYVGCLGQDPP